MASSYTQLHAGRRCIPVNQLQPVAGYVTFNPDVVLTYFGRFHSYCTEVNACSYNSLNGYETGKAAL